MILLPMIDRLWKRWVASRYPALLLRVPSQSRPQQDSAAHRVQVRQRHRLCHHCFCHRCVFLIYERNIWETYSTVRMAIEPSFGLFWSASAHQRFHSPPHPWPSASFLQFFNWFVWLKDKTAICLIIKRRPPPSNVAKHDSTPLSHPTNISSLMFYLHCNAHPCFPLWTVGLSKYLPDGRLLNTYCLHL